MSEILEKLFILFIILGTTITSCISCSPATKVNRVIVLEESEDSIKLWPSVAKVSTIPINSKSHPVVYLATAWAINPNYLMTAGHFCEGATDLQTLSQAQKELDIEYVDSLGRVANKITGTIEAFIHEDEKDMCLIKSNGHGLMPLDIKKDSSGIETEDRIISFGAPKGKFPIRREGFIAVVLNDVILISVEIQPGNSGGPLIWQGQVVGMIIAAFTDVNEFGLAVNSETLLKFISEHIE